MVAEIGDYIVANVDRALLCESKHSDGPENTKYTKIRTSRPKNKKKFWRADTTPQTSPIMGRGHVLPYMHRCLLCRRKTSPSQIQILDPPLNATHYRCTNVLCGPRGE